MVRGNNYRNHYGRRGGNRDWGNRKRPFTARSNSSRRNDVPNQLEESEVGITEYISKLDGFSGVIKARYSDFLVNEIDLDGNIAQITKNTVPDVFIKRKHDEPIPEESPVPGVDNAKWKEILDLLKWKENTRVQLDCSKMNKEERTQVHKAIKQYFGTKILSHTIKEDEKHCIEFRHQNSVSSDGKFRTSFDWPENCPPYVHFLLHKQNLGTMEAILHIAKALKMSPSAFNYAGVKDRRGLTTQWVSAWKIVPQRLFAKTRSIRNIFVGNVVCKEQPLSLGQLKGNRFSIVLRNVTADDARINEALESLKTHGFINYYGLQRFGNDKEAPTHEIGIKLMQGKWEEACKLILKPKDAEDSYSNLYKAKKCYQTTSNAKEACKLLDNNSSMEALLLEGLAKNNDNDYVNSLENVPRNMRLLYIHAFQSYIWNKVVSKRIKDHGIKPIVGDLVLDDLTMAEECEDVSDNDNDSKEEADNKIKVKILKESDLDNYTIYDIVLPLPGHSITYPDNSIKDYYKELLEQHDLSLEMPKQRVKTYSLGGNYRQIIRKVNNLEWKFMHYDDYEKSVIQADIDILFKRDKPVDVPDGKFKCLILLFELHSSSYATMVIRELIKMDTSTNNQSKLNNYHGSTETTPLIKTKPTSPLKMENSLLDDKEKFEAFKKLIFDGDSNDGDEMNSSTEPQDTAKKQKIATYHGSTETTPLIRTEPTSPLKTENSLLDDKEKFEAFKPIFDGDGNDGDEMNSSTEPHDTAKKQKLA